MPNLTSVFNLGPSELLIIAMVGIVGMAVPIWGIVDAAQRPDAAWEAAGQNKTLWIVLQAAGLVVCGVAIVFSVIYFAVIRPQVQRATPAA